MLNASIQTGRPANQPGAQFVCNLSNAVTGFRPAATGAPTQSLGLLFFVHRERKMCGA
jgi:hypothetical protein